LNRKSELSGCTSCHRRWRKARISCLALSFHCRPAVIFFFARRCLAACDKTWCRRRPCLRISAASLSCSLPSPAAQIHGRNKGSSQFIRAGQLGFDKFCVRYYSERTKRTESQIYTAATRAWKIPATCGKCTVDVGSSTRLILRIYWSSLNSNPSLPNKAGLVHSIRTS